MSEWNERMYEARARYISAAYLIDTDEIAVLAPEVPLPETHNCDAMGCGSMSHVAFRAPRDVMSQLDGCEDKLRGAEAELAELGAALDKIVTITSCVREHDVSELCAVVESVREIAVKVLCREAGDNAQGQDGGGNAL